MQTVEIHVTGHVQGVGFRPFVYRLAKQHQLAGSVRNRSGEVFIICQGQSARIKAFTAAITTQAPPLAKPVIQSSRDIDCIELTGFEIAASQKSDHADIHVPPDYFTCNECLEELGDAGQHRYRYPFTNCTQCGPRYTIITGLPYDRPNTSMQDFPLCDHCRKEYLDPNDRRFHAQPLACQDCGPRLSFHNAESTIEGNEASLTACISALQDGLIIAVKGIGGYHLVCDALNADSIARLRQRKNRPHKPLAVMFPPVGEDSLDSVRELTNPTPAEQQSIQSPQRPIVLVAKKTDSVLPETIAPGLAEIGVFLPYSPLHHLLLKGFGSPLVATSGNISGEPVITDNDYAQLKLDKVCDAFLQHNRHIVRPADDSVIRHMARQKIIIRAGRGLAPLELNLPSSLDQPILAVGGHLKSTVALAWQNRVVVSPHISDLDSRRGVTVFEQVIEDLQQLYQVRAEHIICDAHPGYESTRWARKQPLPVTPIWHHHAHAASVCGEYPQVRDWLMFCWDGVGLGTDNTLWGGETFVGAPGRWQHLAGLRPFFLPGADRAGRQPWRSAAAMQWETGNHALPDIDQAELALQAWQKKLNCPQSSAVGRLFDAAANWVLGIGETGFEGQGPMQLEAVAAQTDEYIDLPIALSAEGIYRTDWSVLIGPLRDSRRHTAQRSALFHNSLAHHIIRQAKLFQAQHSFEAIGLSGGVFQNRYLVDKILSLAEQHGLEIRLASSVPVNDGGISYGQVIEYRSVSH